MACVTFQCLANPAVVPFFSRYHLSDPWALVLHSKCFHSTPFPDSGARLPFACHSRTPVWTQDSECQAESPHQPVLHRRTLGQFPR